MNKKRLVLIFSMILALVMAFSFGASQVFAKKSVKEIDKELKEKKSELKEGESKADALQEEIDKYQEQIDENEKLLSSLETDTKRTEIDILKVKKKMAIIEKNLDTQDKALNERLRAVYKSGSVGYIDVLLGSESIYDFISNVDIVQKIYENDKELIATLQKSYDAVKTEKKRLNVLKEKLAQQEKKETKARNKLAVAKMELNEKKSGVDKKNQSIENDIQELQEDRDALTNVINNDTTGKTRVYGGGKFCYPCPGHTNITSGYGYRGWGAGGGMHYGIDFGAPQGATVVAAGAGEVIKASYQGSYGNCVMISHGSNLYTLYAHNSSLACSVGQHVKKGQRIAYVGSTGYSTGPHCHFEVYKGGTQWGVGYQVNPMGYLK